MFKISTRLHSLLFNTLQKLPNIYTILFKPTNKNSPFLCSLVLKKPLHNQSFLKHALLIGASTGFVLTSFIQPVNASEKPKTNLISRSMNFIADVVELAAPAVVVIEIESRQPFSGQKITLSNGSGFIVRSDGLILTNAHVVADKSVVQVRLSDGRVLEGSVQAVDSISDLATVKIKATGLPVLPLGNSEELRAGEFVVAMGSPLRLNNTVTAGIVSSTHRKSKDLGLYNKDIDYIQTDAGINFGNSGGPLVNLDGQVIGINTLTAAAGISFAIPSDYAKQFLHNIEQIEKRGNSSSSWFNRKKSSSPNRQKYLGITMVTLNKDLMQKLKFTQPEIADLTLGVLVYRVMQDSPAYNAGLLPGDIITSINNTVVKNSSDVYNAVESSVNIDIMIRRGAGQLLLNIPLVDIVQ